MLVIVLARKKEVEGYRVCDVMAVVFALFLAAKR